MYVASLCLCVVCIMCGICTECSVCRSDTCVAVCVARVAVYCVCRSKWWSVYVLTPKGQMYRDGQNHLYTVHIRYFWQGNNKKTRSYTVHLYGSGQPYKCRKVSVEMKARERACVVRKGARAVLDT